MLKPFIYSLLFIPFYLHAQIPSALDITCSSPIRDFDGSVLSGNNPSTGAGFTLGGLVQLVEAGANGKADLPGANGSAGGDDTILSTSSIGTGMLAALDKSGRFTFSVIPAPAEGTRVYLRVFNQALPGPSASWGQSALFTVSGETVFDAGQLGLNRTTIPVGPVGPGGGSLESTDSDGDGLLDVEELIANSNARDRGEAFSAKKLLSGRGLAFQGYAGRDYILMRSLTLSPPSWTEVIRTGILAADQAMTLEDPSPLLDQAFYQLGVEFPGLN